MANQTATPLQLHWQRLPDGRLAISVVLPLKLQSQKGDETRFAPLNTWVLSAEEEVSLKATLQGLSVAQQMPDLKIIANGRKQ